MISLSQMTIAGLAGYFLALMGSSSADNSLGLLPIIAIPAALIMAALVATFFGWLSVSTAGVYTIMITLAMGVETFSLVPQNYNLYHGLHKYIDRMSVV